ncbi:MAG: hypothetical protein O3C62_10610 [Actinomycetota bacterium]|nr:hypothetical protein [Actinomycetota bacterium]MDA2972306.1 hypothetical protein [Actinomycetota bacterium]MDA3002118.1 hypothetical protein [Actinomycetota bacterium]
MSPNFSTPRSTLSLRAAQWVDADLDETLDETLRYRASRVFAIHDGEHGFVRELVDCDADPYELITRLPPTIDFDVACLVMTGWMTPLDDDDHDDDGDDNDGDDDHDDDEPCRFRVRLTAAVSDDGVAVVVRRWEGHEWSDSFADGGEGAFPDALRTWWRKIDEVRRLRGDRSPR